MTVARAKIQTVANLITDVRREVGDPATDRSGNTIAAAQLRFSGDEVQTACVYAISELGIEMQVRHSGEALLSTDFTYTANADSVAIPVCVGTADRIFKVEDIANTDFPVTVQYVTPLEIEDYRSQSGFWRAIRYTLHSKGSKDHIAIRPENGSDRSYRIWYVAPPLVPDATTDGVGLSTTWRELLVLLAASKLMRRDDEMTAAQAADLSRLYTQFKALSNRQKGPQTIRRKRYGRS